MKNLVEIKNLEVRFNLKEGIVRAVNGVSLDIASNRTLGLVGESGCGKSVTARAILRILPARGRIVRGNVLLQPRDEDGDEPVDLTTLDPQGEMIRRIRGADIAMVFQEPMTSFSPVHSVGNQICENIRLHQNASRKEARGMAIDLLGLVGVPNPAQRIDAYPHELSGGLRQRCMIAKALSCRPRLLIADEPTTALDVTIQAQILELIDRLKRDQGMAVLMITHDLAVIAETADDVAVMYLGRIVEQAPARTLFESPLHPYTRGLLKSIPVLGSGQQGRLESIQGSVPDPFSVPGGCPFHPRCPDRIKGVCDIGEPPELKEEEEGRSVACHLYGRS
jgi:peptide/nickel transport system ATP-binding protein